MVTRARTGFARAGFARAITNAETTLKQLHWPPRFPSAEENPAVDGAKPPAPEHLGDLERVEGKLCEPQLETGRVFDSIHLVLQDGKRGFRDALKHREGDAE